MSKMVDRGQAVALFFALFLSLAPARASAAPLISGLGGPVGYGTGNLPANDDRSSAEIDVRAAFPDGLHFFGMTFGSLYVNNNGNVSFGGPVGTFTPSPFPVASQRMIAAWWGDVDTRGGGFPARNGVWWSISPGRFVATWNRVGYFSTHDDLQNDFQIVLTAAGPGVGDFNVELRYNRCEWTTGDASGGMGGFGGTPAQAGFDAGNLVDYIALPGSLTREVLALCTTSNVRIPGVWRFEIRGGEVMCPGRGEECSTGEPGVCDVGRRTCVSPEESVCTAISGPNEEICNGLDDDCDRGTDEALGTATCGIGECVASVANCVGGVPQTCVPREPSAERCNLLDDDCDGVFDELPDLGCGVGECIRFTQACDRGMPLECVPGTPVAELCNGLDDDCDGASDDGLIGCISPDAGRRDAGPSDAGRRDASSTDASAGDASVRADVECIGIGCNPFRLGGRAGPIGCACRAAGGPPSFVGALVLCGLVVAAASRRR